MGFTPSPPSPCPVTNFGAHHHACLSPRCCPAIADIGETRRTARRDGEWHLFSRSGLPLRIRIRSQAPLPRSGPHNTQRMAPLVRPVPGPIMRTSSVMVLGILEHFCALSQEGLVAGIVVLSSTPVPSASMFEVPASDSSSSFSFGPTCSYSRSWLFVSSQLSSLPAFDTPLSESSSESVCSSMTVTGHSNPSK